MNTVHLDIASVEEQIEALRRLREEIDELSTRQRLLATATISQLDDVGIDAHIVEPDGQVRVGDRTVLWRTWTRSASGVVRQDLRAGYAADDRRGPMVGYWAGSVTGALGLYEYLVVDDNFCIVARVLDDPFEESGHRQAVARVRRQAAHEGFRCRLRDREVTLIDPMGNVVHAGDVWSATLWIEGIYPAGAVAA
ncbi:hypothetical protein [Microbacterium sp. SORGH_AS_0888]|uniref:hypothetical protein n=1 Tax=Microbacterium sp. SORGH_AS_0888 TaxID=3041791 RepID=UPI002783FBDE|nr:hypothetical protein [Microbacterium sp. SORGH_AS_0888]MDQ1130237.1 hypothetical protein [Microbacterium sp. SORGH_AS_0888]